MGLIMPRIIVIGDTPFAQRPEALFITVLPRSHIPESMLQSAIILTMNAPIGVDSMLLSQEQGQKRLKDMETMAIHAFDEALVTKHVSLDRPDEPWRNISRKSLCKGHPGGIKPGKRR